MSHIRLLWSGVDVEPLAKELEEHPELWDANPFRRSVGSPHIELSDIIVRYNDWRNFQDRTDFNEEHESVWWDAHNYLPSINKIVFDLMRKVEGERLGMVLITKIPPHKSCKRHTDGGWHASYYDKYAVQIKANEKQKFCFDDSELVTKPGDVFSFDNAFPHWVTNCSDEERITLIVCIKTRK